MTRWLVLVVSLCACTSIPPQDPQISVDSLSAGVWFLGERQHLSVEWLPGEQCTNNGWSCEHGDAPEFQITHMTCDGCRAFDVPYGVTFANAAGFDFEATTTDAITVQVTIDGGDGPRELTVTGVGDQELEVVARCDTVFTGALDDSVISSDELTPCGATRGPQESAMVDVEIRTLRGSDRFPFCPDDAVCSPAWPRKTSMISIDPPPDRWRADTPVFTGAAGATVAISAPLVTGEISSTSVVVPPVAPAS